MDRLHHTDSEHKPTGYVLSAQEAAKLKGCAEATIIKAARRGDLPFSRKGMPNGTTKRLFRASDLEAWTPPKMPHEPTPRMDPEAFKALWLSGVAVKTIETEHAHTQRRHVLAYAEELGILNDPRRQAAIMNKLAERNRKCAAIGREESQRYGAADAAKVWRWWAEGESLTTIARRLGCVRGTVSRLMRNHPRKPEGAA